MDINIVSVYIKNCHGIKGSSIFSVVSQTAKPMKIDYSSVKGRHSRFTLYQKFSTNTK